MKDQQQLMSEEEFEEYLDNSVNLQYFGVVNKFKSVNRAFKRGQITSYGVPIPKRPFNNKKNTCKRKGKHSRGFNERKKNIYNEMKQYGTDEDFE